MLLCFGNLFRHFYTPAVRKQEKVELTQVTFNLGQCDSLANHFQQNDSAIQPVAVGLFEVTARMQRLFVQSFFYQ
jgi:hypothetical protein